MHWWQMPFSSPSKPQSAAGIVTAATGSERNGYFTSRRSRAKLTENDVEEWRPESYTEFQQSWSRSSSANAQPLPLPREPRLVASRSHNVPLPSPCEKREINQLTRFVGENTWTSTEQTEFRLSRKSAVKQYASERPSCSCNVITPKSAPTSPYSNPVSSPPRSDISTTYYMTSPGIFHPWSKESTGLSFNDQIPADDYPHESPRVSSCVHVESLPGPALPLPSKISLETPVAWREISARANGHTLPLPPGADMSLPPTPVSSNSSTSDLSGATTSLPTTPISTLVIKPELPAVKRASPVSHVVSKPEPIPNRSQWQKGKLIGRGAFGSVYVASNRETGALCAMKEVEILPEDKKSQESMRQLEQEIKVLSNLKHPNIVQYYGSEIVGDKFYIYLEYVHPGSINKFIHDHCTAITESVIRNFTRHILRGLAYLHSTKTIHRDIKAANLLVDAHGVVKLADFGVAKHLTGEAAILSLKGSPYWLAPELLQSVVSKDASVDLALAVDIWSLGCTIIEMITGKPPWSDCERAAALFKVLKESPPIPEPLSADGKDFLQCCFCRNPADRPTAIRLLDHPFVNSTQSPKQKETMQLRRAHPCHKLNQKPASLDEKIKKGKLAIKASLSVSPV